MLLLFEEAIQFVSWEKEKPNTLKIFFAEKASLEKFFFSAKFELLGVPGQKKLHSGILQLMISSGKTLAEMEKFLTTPPPPKYLTLEFSSPLEGCHSIKFYNRTKKDMIIHTTFPIMKN